jgi:hypothetical protein
MRGKRRNFKGLIRMKDMLQFAEGLKVRSREHGLFLPPART